MLQKHDHFIPAEHLLSLVREYNPKSDQELLRHAYEYGKNMHKGQKRRSGDDYFTHPIAVAIILAEQHLDDITIAAALLHDVIEDTESNQRDINDRFGPHIFNLVNGVTKLTKLELGSENNEQTENSLKLTEQAENLRKLFLAIGKDKRVIFVKIADRLHNMRTISYMPQEKQINKARETMEIYAPLAGRMGMRSIREELEDIAFGVLNPKARSSILRSFKRLQEQTGNIIETISDNIKAELELADIDAKVFGRAKKPYAIWRKMAEKNREFSSLSDIYGFRIVTQNETDCYTVLGVIHRRWRAVPGRLKDYISQPKLNGYRSIHTTVTGNDGKRVEMQIRTQKMEQVAESGIAAHWAYRDGVRNENSYTREAFEWIDTLNETFQKTQDNHEFLEGLKSEMYAEQVFCFTPVGDVLQLPRGSTVLDFAYAIHTEIGNKCTGVKIDGQQGQIPLSTPLRNGQSINVVTDNRQTPHSAWLESVQTTKAKEAIRRALRDQKRDEYIRMGREIARVAFHNVKKKLTDKVLIVAAKELKLKSADDLLLRLGNAEINSQRILEIVYPDLPKNTEQKKISKNRSLVGLTPGQSFSLAKCCQPIPGERIVGHAYPGQGVTIHTTDCLLLHQPKTGNCSPIPNIEVHWHYGPHAPEYRVTCIVVLRHDPGVLGHICTLIGEQNTNMVNIYVSDRKPDFFRLLIDIEVSDAKHLNVVMKAIETDADVALIERYNPYIHPDRMPKPEETKSEYILYDH